MGSCLFIPLQNTSLGSNHASITLPPTISKEIKRKEGDNSRSWISVSVKPKKKHFLRYESKQDSCAQEKIEV